MTSAFNGRIYTAITNDKKPFKIIWNGQIWNEDLWVLTKGSKHAQAAMDFIKFATDPAVLATQTKYIAYGPLRKSALALVDPAVAPFLPTYPANLANALHYDAAFWADHADELNQQFNAWLAK
jgi:putative spermidine/putrescine transport system substrate-binding protein